MTYDEAHAFEKVHLLRIAKEKGFNTVRYGTMKQLSNILPHNTFVVVYTRPIVVTEVQWAYQSYQNCLGHELAGNINGPTTCIKTVQAGRMSWGIVYKNEKGWKTEKKDFNMKWRAPDKEPILDYPVFMIETIDSKVVRVQTKGFGIHSLGTEGLTDFDFKSIERELRKEALTKSKEFGKISNIVTDRMKNS
jgi:hypothetical protein